MPSRRGGVPTRPLALVTGAGRGIGAAVAIGAAREGHDVCLNYARDAASAESVAERCRGLGARAVALRADVADREAVRELFARCEGELGAPALVVNNAGIIGGATTLLSLEPATLERVFAVNVFGTLWCLQEAAARMARSRGGAGGAIINLSSVAATLGSPGEYVHYAASKGAVESLTVGAGKELAGEGVRVVAVRAGTTATDMHAREGNPERPALAARAAPLGRIATAEEIADAVLFLASDRARFVTGTVLTVAGGLAP